MNHRKTCCGRDFTLVVAGQIISLFGNAILRFALPLYLLKETGSSALFGTVTALALLPMILLSLLGGVLADRVNKRNIMAGLDFLTAFIILVFYVLVGRAPVIPLFIVTLMLLYGISGTYQPAVQASIPALVPKERVLPASAIVNQIGSLASFIGPVIGGMLYGFRGIGSILKVIEHVADWVGVLADGSIAKEVSMAQVRKDCPEGLEDYFFNIMRGGVRT